MSKLSLVMRAEYIAADRANYGSDDKNLTKTMKLEKMMKMRLRGQKRDVKIYLSKDEAEGQRPNLSSMMNITDLSKLSLGRMKSVQIFLNLVKIGVMPVVTRR